MSNDDYAGYGEILEDLTNERDKLAEQLRELRELLARVEPELVPNYDEAERVARKFGLWPSKTTLIVDIRAALARTEADG